jgi:outer membrane protein OmpA-like peptidoglycan-associated protein
MKKTLVLFLFTFIFIQAIWAQGEEKVNINKSKRKLYKYGIGSIQSGNYFLAKVYFDALHDKGFENNDQIYNYSKLLNTLGDFENSNKYIDSLLTKKYDNPLLIYQKTLVCMKLQKEKDALDYATFFLKNRENKTNFPSETRHLKELKRYLDSLSFRIDSIEYSVYNLSDAINGPASEFSPIITNDGLLYGKQGLDKIKYYNSNQLSKGKVSPTRKIYLAKGTGMNLMKAELFDIQIPDREISSICFDVSQRNAYLSACKFDEKTEKYICNIFHVKKIRNAKKEWIWDTPILVPELYEENVSMTHVSFAFDPFKNTPIIYFSSNKEEGRGGMDIWYSYLNLKTNKFGKIVNAGGKINTSRDDITPNYHSQSKTLYFSSNGRGGYGGFDIYGSHHKEGAFQEVKQLGQEVNSSQDDIFYYPNRDLTNGYLVSNRYSSHSLINPHCCDDIFYFDKNANLRNKTKININVTSNHGNVIPNFEYTIWEIDSNGIRTPLENKSAKDSALIENLRHKSHYEIEVFNNKFFRKKITKRTLEDSFYNIKITLDSIDFRPILLPLIEFDFDSFIINNESRYIVDSLVYPILLANPTLVIELSAHTDSRGTDEYNELLSEKRAQSMKEFLQNYREINPKRLKAKGYGEFVPIVPNENPDGTDNPEGRQRNRRCEFKILDEEFYD